MSLAKPSPQKIFNDEIVEVITNWCCKPNIFDTSDPAGVGVGTGVDVEDAPSRELCAITAQ